MTEDTNGLCVYCGEWPWQPGTVDDDDRVYETPCCEDQGFARFGDMSSINELRATKGLRDPANVRQRDEWIAQYELAGLDPDEDPGSFELSIPPAPGESLDEHMQRILGAVLDAVHVRLSTPEDWR